MEYETSVNVLNIHGHQRYEGHFKLRWIIKCIEGAMTVGPLPYESNTLSNFSRSSSGHLKCSHRLKPKYEVWKAGGGSDAIPEVELFDRVFPIGLHVG